MADLVKVKVLHAGFGSGIKEMDKEKAERLAARGVVTFDLVAGETETFTKADLDAAFERGKASAEPQGEFVVNEEVVKKFLTDAIESRGENVRSDAKLSTLAKKYEELPAE